MKIVLAQKDIGNELCQDVQIIADILGASIAYFSVRNFAGGEKLVTLESELSAANEIYIFHKLQPELYQGPNEKLMELFILLDFLVNEGCGNINIISPFIPYLRQDRKLSELSSVGSRVIANLFSHFHVNNIYTFDCHSDAAKSFFCGSLVNMSYNKYFALKIKSLVVDLESNQILVVSPDFGGAVRAKNLARMINSEYHCLKKERKDGVVSLSSFSNLSDKKYGAIILIDDIIDSGATIIAGIRAVLNSAKSVILCVSHILRSEALEKIQIEFPGIIIISPGAGSGIDRLTDDEIRLVYQEYLSE